MKDEMRFKLGWGYVLIVLGISLLVHASLGNLGLSAAIFLVGAGTGSIFLGYLDPRMPLILGLGAVLVLMGAGLLMVTSAVVQPLFILGCLVLLLGVGYLLYPTKSGGA